MKSPKEYEEQINNIYSNIQKDCYDLVINFGKENEQGNTIELNIQNLYIIKDWERKIHKLSKVAVTIRDQNFFVYDENGNIVIYNKRDISYIYWVVFNQVNK